MRDTFEPAPLSREQMLRLMKQRRQDILFAQTGRPLPEAFGLAPAEWRLKQLDELLQGVISAYEHATQP